jgi:low density lipoprotein receptor-related protein 5/6
MNKSNPRIAIRVAALILMGAHPLFGADLAVVSVSPSRHTVTAAVGSPIVVNFDRPVNVATITSNSFWAFGRWSGTRNGGNGLYSFSNGNQTVTLTPNRAFSAGEMVMVILSHDIAASDGAQETLRGAGYSWQFWAKAQPADMDFTQIGSLSTRDPGAPGTLVRTYGGFASDLNDDGWLDLGMVQEDSADVRTFLNLADGTGLYNATFQSFPVENMASPNEPSDFNRDGNVDVCTANVGADSISVLLGNGDGTFGTQQVISIGGSPRGVAVLDADGDGDTDIVATDNNNGALYRTMNDGTGVFGAAIAFEAGPPGTTRREWVVAAADMNDDAILDLVVGNRSGGQTGDACGGGTHGEIVIVTGNGDGTFTAGTQSACADGRVWMLVVGDVNNDGKQDVATCSINNGSAAVAGGGILLGNGDGTLQSVVPYTINELDPTAVDLGDLDGDGDLDMVIGASTAPGKWSVFRNDGTGTYTLKGEIPAPNVASCAIFLDFDNDGDLDLGLVDEFDDSVTLMRNEPPGSAGSAKIYWTDRGFDKIQRASPSILAPNVEDLVTTGLDSTFGIALDVAGGKMYWVDAGTQKIQRADLDGNNVEDLLTVGLSSPFGLALDIAAGRMYWTDFGSDKIQRAGMDIPGGQTAATRTDVVDLVDTGLSNPFDIALDLDAGKMYFSDGGLDKIQRANLDGTSVEDVITVGSSNTWGIALDTGSGHIYWTDTVLDKIQRADMNGVDQNAVDLVVTGLNSAGGIALDLNTDRMYWVDSGTDKVQRAGLDGSNVTDMISSGLNQPTGIALDVPTPAQPVAPALTGWGLVVLTVMMFACGLVIARRRSALGS